MKKEAKEELSWDEIGKAIGAKIEKESKAGNCKSWWKNENQSKPGCGTGGAFYGLGFLGALVYYITTANGLWAGLIGVLKAIFWPAFLIYELMKFLGM